MTERIKAILDAVTDRVFAYKPKDKGIAAKRTARRILPVFPALSAIPADPVVEARKFDLGDRVTKTKGSSWTGHVVGFYSTNLTKVGYAVESENEPGSVQIYPEGALAACRGGEMETHKETEL